MKVYNVTTILLSILHVYITELKEELIAALEQREATLLVLLDRQVQKREEIIEDEQEEVAFARARAIAAIEEGIQFNDKAS